MDWNLLQWSKLPPALLRTIQRLFRIQRHSLFQQSDYQPFCEGENGNIWIASDDSGLSCFNPSTMQFIDFNGREKLNKKKPACTLHGRKRFMDSTYGDGIQILNTQTGEIKSYNTTNGLDENSIYSIFKDKQGQIWTGSMNGICQYNAQNQQFTPIRHLEALVIEIIEDAKGNLWIATLGGGLFRYSPQKNKEWKKYGQEQGLNGLNINHLCINQDNKLWAATNEGLYLYNPLKDTFEYQRLKCLMNVSMPFWKEKTACGLPLPKDW